MTIRMMLTSVDQDLVNTGVALAPVSMNTVARRAAAVRPSDSPGDTRKATAKSSATASSQATVVKSHPGTDVRSTAVTLEATAVSNRNMVLTLIALADTVVKRSLDMAVARKSRATAVKSRLANLFTWAKVLTLTDPADTVVRRAWNTVASVLISLTAPLVFQVVSVKSLKAMAAAVTMKTNTGSEDRSMAPVVMAAQAGMARRGTEGDTRHDVFSAGSQCGLGLLGRVRSTVMTML